MPIGCVKNRNLSEGSTYVNFGYLHGEECAPENNEMIERRTVILLNNKDKENKKEREQQKESKSSADSDSGAYFEDTEQDQEVQSTKSNKSDRSSHVLTKYENVTIVEPEEIEDKSVQDVLGTLDHMLEKEEEKCGDGGLGVPRFRNRSVSIVSSVSNNSNNLPMEVSVVAIIHHEDEQEPILEEIETPEEPEPEEKLTEATNGRLIQSVQNLTAQEDNSDVDPKENEEVDESKEEEENKKDDKILEDILPVPPPPPLLLKPALPPPPPPPSMSQFEIFKAEPPPKLDYLAARSTLKKSTRAITPPPSASSTPIGTPLSTKRRMTPSKSETDLYTPPEDNIKLTSENIKQFKNKLAADLGHMPNNLKFNVTASPYYHSVTLDRKPTTKRNASIGGKSESVDDLNLSVPKSDEMPRKNSGVVDDSLKSVNMDAIKARLSVLYNTRSDADPATLYRNRKKVDSATKVEFGESGV